MKGVIVCRTCHNLILKYDSDKLAYKTGDSQIEAEDFKSCVAGWPDPKPFDAMECPFCSSDYGITLRNAWKHERSLIIKKDWDE